jgi:hypothetical protein
MIVPLVAMVRRLQTETTSARPASAIAAPSTDMVGVCAGLPAEG